MKSISSLCGKGVCSYFFWDFFLSFSSYAQDITVKGVVKDSKFGDPIIGASVLVKGTTNGTISDMDGNFTLAAPKDGTLTISYIGYKSQEIPVNGQQNLNIILDEDVEALDEVVSSRLRYR